jgi:1-deoxy-D-xylulose 5-phosphate reductoisomerase
LDVIARNPEDFRVVGLAAGGSDLQLLAQQAVATGAPVIALANATSPAQFLDAFTAVAPTAPKPQVICGPDAVVQVASLSCDVVLNAITGSIGLRPTLAALTAGSVVGEIESTKSVGELFAPASGTITGVNDSVVASPELVNHDAFGQGWLIKMTIDEAPQLLSADEYAALTGE